MRRRAHRVTVITNPYFRQIVEDEGLELLPLGTREEYESLARHRDIWHPIRGPKAVLGIMAGYTRTLYELLDGAYQPGETVIAAHGLDLASRTLQQRHGAPVATIHFAPLSLRSLADTPRFFGLVTAGWTPRWFKEFQFWLGDRMFIDPLVGKPLNALRAELGLPEVRRIYQQWHNSPQLVVGLWPEWYGPTQPDWPPHTKLVGFPLWDPSIATGLPADVEEFLAAGAPPVVFAPGSANTQADKFFRVAATVCERLKLRGVLATKYPEQLPQSLPPGVRHFDFVPFSQLLPRCQALVHHGGIGSCAQALAAGLPQLIMPMAYDQLDNAHRVKRLGVGAFLLRKRFKPRRVTRLVDRLLNSTAIRRRANEIAQQCHGPASIVDACQEIEKLYQRRPTAPVSIHAQEE